MEPDFFLVECLASGSDSTCLLNGGCRLTGVMAGALDAMMSHLDGFTLADILPEPPGGEAITVRRPASRRVPPVLAQG